MTVTVYPFDTSAIPDELGWRNTVGRPYLSGVYVAELNEFVTTFSGLALTVGTGRAGIQGTYMESTATISKTVTTNAANGNPRIDYLTLRLDRSANTLLPTVIQGTPAASPVAPALTNTDTTVDVPLYTMRLNANSATINTLTDVRSYAPSQVQLTGTGFHQGVLIFENSGALGFRGIRAVTGASGALEMFTSTGGNSNPYIRYVNAELTSETARFDLSQQSFRLGSAVSMTNAVAGVMGLSNVSSALGGNPSGGGYLYASAGALVWRGSSGTVTTVAPA